MDEQILRRGLELALDRINLPELGDVRRGKVRDSYIGEGRRTIIVTDRVSAFDMVLGTIPFKGQILNQLAAHWFQLSREVAPNHLLTVPDPAASVVQECTPFPVEMVVRAYLTGSSPTSLWTHYARGRRTYCGHQLPDGLRQHEQLPRPLITPTTKAGEGQHDEPISADQVIERGLCTLQEFGQLSALSLALFALGSARAAARGLILVDTKYEFGRNAEGQIMVIDEIHTPDSSRYWYADSYDEALRNGADPRPLDKEYLRRALVARGYKGDVAIALDEELRLETARRYVEIFEHLTGQPFTPDLEPPEQRLRRNLGIKS